jgi:hypothetical protein
VVAITVVLTLGILAAVLIRVVWRAIDMPLSQGSSSGPGESAVFLRSEDDPYGSGTMYVYCPGANGRFPWATSIRNTGTEPVTILGSDPGPIPVDVISKTNGAWQDALAAGQRVTPSNTLMQTHDLGDAAHAAPITPSNPITIGPRDEIELWVWYRTGSAPPLEGGRQIFRSLWIRFSVLAQEREAEIPTRDGVGVQGGPCTTS